MANSAKSTDVAVIGLRAFGSSVARELQSSGKQVLGIDPELRLVESIVDELSQAVALDPTNEDALAEVDIASFDTVIVARAHDFEVTMLTTAILKELNIKRVICQADTDRQQSILLKIGADKVIQPDHSAGKQLAKELLEA